MDTDQANRWENKLYVMTWGAGLTFFTILGMIILGGIGQVTFLFDPDWCRESVHILATDDDVDCPSYTHVEATKYTYIWKCVCNAPEVPNVR